MKVISFYVNLNRTLIKHLSKITMVHGVISADPIINIHYFYKKVHEINTSYRKAVMALYLQAKK